MRLITVYLIVCVSLTFVGCRPTTESQRESLGETTMEGNAPPPTTNVPADRPVSQKPLETTLPIRMVAGTMDTSTNGIRALDSKRAVPLILNSISNDFKGRQFVSSNPSGISEEDLLIDRLIYTLGYFAETNDQAYEFLQAGADPAFWKDIVNWRSQRTIDTYAVLAVRCIQSIGLSGRDDASAKLYALRNGNLISISVGTPPRAINGALVDGAFYASVIRHKGRPYFEDISNQGLRSVEFQRWSKTPEGSEWRTWMKTFDEQHRAELRQ